MSVYIMFEIDTDTSFLLITRRIFICSSLSSQTLALYPGACRGVVFGGAIAPILSAPGVTYNYSQSPRLSGALAFSVRKTCENLLAPQVNS